MIAIVVPIWIILLLISAHYYGSESEITKDVEEIEEDSVKLLLT